MDIDSLKIQELERQYQLQRRVTSRRENDGLLAGHLGQNVHKVCLLVNGRPEQVVLLQGVHGLVLVVHFNQHGVVQGRSLQLLHFGGHRR